LYRNDYQRRQHFASLPKGSSVIEEQVVFRGNRYNIHQLSYRDRQGRAVCKQIIRHPGACVVIPVLDPNRIVLIENFRPSIQRVILELPAGTLEPNEPPIDSARRELAEETGYVAGHLWQLGGYYSSPGICDERMHVFVAEQIVAGPPHREPGEEMTNRIATWDEIIQWLKEGTIEDAKTIAALLWWRMTTTTG
jgi:ADP-ribose pyrophosphatase